MSREQTAGHGCPAKQVVTPDDGQPLALCHPRLRPRRREHAHRVAPGGGVVAVVRPHPPAVGLLPAEAPTL
jgi:hypothetical protein